MVDGYIICGTPRTGSTLLCGLLASAGAGNPNSFYRRQSVAEWADDWGIPAPSSIDDVEGQRSYLDAAIREGRGGTAIFGMRLMHDNLGELSAILGRLFPDVESDRARLERAFGRLAYLHLSRRDKLAQAVSYVRADQTGLWHVAPDGTEVERVAPHREPHYDFARIRREVLDLECHDAAWNEWFAGQGITPLRIGYEGLAADPAATLIGLCEALGVSAPGPDLVAPGVAKLADAVNLDWMERYRTDMEAA
jgi:LPS sulfotransferase NodH